MIRNNLVKLRFNRAILSALVAGALGITSSGAATVVEVVNYFNVPGQVDALSELQKDFEKANPDITIKYTYIPFGELMSRTLQMAAVHRPPAIAILDNPDVLRVARSGILKDISADVGKLAVWKDLYPGPKSAVVSGDKTFGVPIGSNSLAIFYNRKLLTDAGVQPPKTWEQLTDVAAKTKKSPVYGIAFSAVNTEEATWQWEPFLWSNGGTLENLDSENAKVALQLWINWIQNGVASKDVVNWNQGDVANQFISGQAAMMVMGPWMLDAVKKAQVDFGVTPIPVPTEGAKPVVPLGGEVWCVLKGDPKVEAAAIKFITFTQEPARLRKVCDAFNYISSVRAVAKDQGEANPELVPFVAQMETARARSQDGGAKYPEISLVTRAAIQQSLVGQVSVENALKDAATKIKAIIAGK